MPTLIQEDYFVCTDFDRNNNKFWKIQLFDDGTVTTHWGRVGVSNQSKSWNFSGSEAKQQYNKKIADKLKVKTGRDAYTKVDIISSTPSSQSISLEAIATREIDADSEPTRDILQRGRNRPLGDKLANGRACPEAAGF